MNDLRSYHNAHGPEALAALINDPANFTVVDCPGSTSTQSTAAPGAGASPAGTAAGSAVDFTDLDARRIHLEHPPQQPVPVFTLLSQQICTAGNLTVIFAQAKGGKKRHRGRDDRQHRDRAAPGGRGRRQPRLGARVRSAGLHRRSAGRPRRGAV